MTEKKESRCTILVVHACVSERWDLCWLDLMSYTTTWDGVYIIRWSPTTRITRHLDGERFSTTYHPVRNNFSIRTSGWTYVVRLGFNKITNPFG